MSICNVCEHRIGGKKRNTFFGKSTTFFAGGFWAKKEGLTVACGAVTEGEAECGQRECVMLAKAKRNEPET